MSSKPLPAWSIQSWRKLPCRHQPTYTDQKKLEEVKKTLNTLPGIVPFNEVKALRERLKDVYDGKCFYLQGGHCAETFSQCDQGEIQTLLDILALQKRIISEYTGMDVVALGRVAGQYAKPRSSPYETINGVEMESFKGDIINSQKQGVEARLPDPDRMLMGYFRAAACMNYIRASRTTTTQKVDQATIGQVDATLARLDEKRAKSGAGPVAQRLSKELVEGTDAKSTLNAGSAFFISHEGLLMDFEESLTRELPVGEEKSVGGGAYNSSAHMLWIGHRTRGLEDAHVEYFRGLANPIGVKVGPGTTPDLLSKLLARLNPSNEAGKVILISRFGAKGVLEALPPLVKSVKASGAKVIWICDPMHGNTYKAAGFKTRDFATIVAEIQNTFAVHQQCGTRLGGVHLEMCGQDVTECVGGPEKLGVDDLPRCFTTACDPRLNFRQSVALGFLLGSLFQKQK